MDSDGVYECGGMKLSDLSGGSSSRICTVSNISSVNEGARRSDLLPLGNGTRVLTLRTNARTAGRLMYAYAIGTHVHTGKHSRLHDDHLKARIQKATQLYTSFNIDNFSFTNVFPWS